MARRPVEDPDPTDPHEYDLPGVAGCVAPLVGFALAVGLGAVVPQTGGWVLAALLVGFWGGMALTVVVGDWIRRRW